MAEPANIDQRLQELLEISAAQAKRIRAWESARAQDGGLCDWHRLISEHLHRLEALRDAVPSAEIDEAPNERLRMHKEALLARRAQLDKLFAEYFPEDGRLWRFSRGDD